LIRLSGNLMARHSSIGTWDLCRAVFLLLCALACSKPSPHDEALAGKRALEFSEAAFVRRDYAAAYKLLSDKAKAYQSVENFKKAVGRLELDAAPTNLKVTAWKPLPGEDNALDVILVEQNTSKPFAYRVTLERTHAADYRVALFRRD
jgi:hypothetical protein